MKQIFLQSNKYSYQKKNLPVFSRGFTPTPIEDTSQQRPKRTSSLVSGFTLIEIMVSVAIFAIIVTAGMGALVSMTRSYQVSQSDKKVHQGLNYSLEAMTREIRLGRNYVANASATSEEVSLQGEDGVGSTLKVTTSDNRGTVIYYVSGGILYLKRFGATNAQNGTFALTNNSQITVDNLRFTVVGTESRDELNYQQPLVWIQIQAHATGTDRNTVIQTMVSQRTLDA